jgi:hypothetical protein
MMMMTSIFYVLHVQSLTFLCTTVPGTRILDRLLILPLSTKVYTAAVPLTRAAALYLSDCLFLFFSNLCRSNLCHPVMCVYISPLSSTFFFIPLILPTCSRFGLYTFFEKKVLLVIVRIHRLPQYKCAEKVYSQMSS